MITVAMAVNAVQKAEENPNPGTFAPAQELIDAIPDQDLLTRQNLQARLDVHKGESK